MQLIFLFDVSARVVVLVGLRRKMEPNRDSARSLRSGIHGVATVVSGVEAIGPFLESGRMATNTVETGSRARSSSGQSTGLRSRDSSSELTCPVCSDEGHGADRCPLAIATTAHPDQVPAGERERIARLRSGDTAFERRFHRELAAGRLATPADLHRFASEGLVSL